MRRVAADKGKLRHCEPLRPQACTKRNRRSRLLARSSAHTGVAIRFSPLAPTLRELSRSDREGKNRPLRPFQGHLSHGERQGPHPSRLRRATYTLLCNCHWQLLDFDSLRGAPPHGGRLRVRIVTGGNPWKGPHQRALHYGMTATGSHCNFNSLRGAPLVRNDSIYRNALQERYRACTQWSVDYRPTGARIARRGSRQKDVPQKCGTPFEKGFGKNRISRRRR